MRKRYRITREELVAAWTTSSTLAEAAKKLNAPVTVVSSRATRLRKQGVRLKKMATGHSPVNVKALNDLIDSLR